MRYPFVAATAAFALLTAMPAWAQQGQQPANAREVSPTAPTATENGVTKPQGPTTGSTSQGPTGKSK